MKETRASRVLMWACLGLLAAVPLGVGGYVVYYKLTCDHFLDAKIPKGNIPATKSEYIGDQIRSLYSSGGVERARERTTSGSTSSTPATGPRSCRSSSPYWTTTRPSR